MEGRDRGTEGRRDGETEGWRDGGTEDGETEGRREEVEAVVNVREGEKTDDSSSSFLFFRTCISFSS
jgi:hypothetical protein